MTFQHQIWRSRYFAKYVVFRKYRLYAYSYCFVFQTNFRIGFYPHFSLQLWNCPLPRYNNASSLLSWFHGQLHNLCTLITILRSLFHIEAQMRPLTNSNDKLCLGFTTDCNIFDGVNQKQPSLKQLIPYRIPDANRTSWSTKLIRILWK